MRKGKSLIGMRVISEADGADLGTVKDLVFDHDANNALALLMSEKDLFGLIEAQVIPWAEITHFGPDAITVNASSSRVKAGEVSEVKSVMHRNTALSGTRVYTTDGRHLGTLADTFLNDETGHIEGYELSGGFVSDTVSGKKYLPADYDLVVGRDVALVPPSAATELDAQAAEPAGLQATLNDAGQGMSGVFETAKSKVVETYENIATASVEKQKAFVVGRTAGYDVVIPAEQMDEPVHAGAPLADSELQTPGTHAETDISTSGEVVNGEVLVRQGEVISAFHADRAEMTGVLGALVASALSGAASETVAVGQERLSSAIASGGRQAENAAIGKPAAHEVIAPDGSVIVAEGQIVTREIMEQAKLFEREKDVMTAAGLGAASQTAQGVSTSVAHSAGSFWDAAKEKISELTGAAHDKKVEYEAHSEKNKINHALGRPVTRVILDTNDAVILNTGDIITHAAVDRARAAGVLDLLLDSVSSAEPEIAPEMMRAETVGEASLENQQQHPSENRAQNSNIIVP